MRRNTLMAMQAVDYMLREIQPISLCERGQASLESLLDKGLERLQLRHQAVLVWLVCNLDVILSELEQHLIVLDVAIELELLALLFWCLSVSAHANNPVMAVMQRRIQTCNCCFEHRALETDIVFSVMQNYDSTTQIADLRKEIRSQAGAHHMQPEIKKPYRPGHSR